MSQPYQTQISGAQILRFTIASVNRKRSTYPTLPVQEITNILSEREKTLLCEKMCQFINLIFHTYTQPAKTTRDWHLSTPHTECLDFIHFSQIRLTSLNCLPLSRVNEPRVSNKPTLWSEEGNSRDMSNQMQYFDWPMESQWSKQILRWWIYYDGFCQQ